MGSLDYIPAHAYKPGTAVIPNISAPITDKKIEGAFFPVTGRRRVLTPDEFQMYHALLNPEITDIDSGTKIAIATVLRADLARVYSNADFDLYKDQLIERWYGDTRGLKMMRFWSYQNTAKYLRLLAEIRAFDKYLVKPTSEILDNKDLDDDLKNQAYFPTFKMHYKNFERDNRIAADRARQDEEDEKLEQGKKETAFIEKFSGEAKIRYRVWVKKKILEYMNAVFSMSILATINDYSKATWEKQTRLHLLDLVNTDELDALEMLDLYRQCLDAVVDSGSYPEYFLKKSKILKGRFMKHPLARVL